MNEPARRYASSGKPRECPACGAESVASILYGLPDFSNAGLQRDLDSGKVVLGGCCVSHDDPAWHCAACGADIYRRRREDPDLRELRGP